MKKIPSGMEQKKTPYLISQFKEVFSNSMFMILNIEADILSHQNVNKWQLPPYFRITEALNILSRHANQHHFGNYQLKSS